MIGSFTTFEDIMRDIELRLLSDALMLPGVSILSARYSTTTDADGNLILEVADIETRIFNALAGIQPRDGKSGAAITITYPTTDEANSNAPTLDCMMLITLEVRVNPLFNNGADGTRKSEGQLAAYLTQLLPGAYGGTGAMLLLAKQPITPAQNLPEGINGFDVHLRMRTGIPYDAGDKLAMPAISHAAGMATITGDGTLYYTLDGTSPCSANPDVLTYSAPFAVAPGDRIRAAAEAAGKIASSITFTLIP